MKTVWQRWISLAGKPSRIRSVKILLKTLLYIHILKRSSLLSCIVFPCVLKQILNEFVLFGQSVHKLPVILFIEYCMLCSYVHLIFVNNFELKWWFVFTFSKVQV